MRSAPTLPSYPLYLLLHPVHSASLRAAKPGQLCVPPPPEPGTRTAGDRYTPPQMELERP